jgi:hypothetical protein
MTRFQLIFRQPGKRDHLEIRDDNQHPESHIDGKLIVDGQTYVIRGVEWFVNADGGHADCMKRFVCTLAVQPAGAREATGA